MILNDWPGNKILEFSNYRFLKEGLEKERDLLRILHLSDLQGASFGENNVELLRKVSEAKPHLIVFTGDLVDRRMHVDKDFGPTIEFMSNLKKIAPTFFSYGNHELAFSSSTVDDLGEKLENAGVVVLDGNSYIQEIQISEPMNNGEQRNLDLDSGISKFRNLRVLLTGFPERLLMVKGKNRTKKNSDVDLKAVRCAVDELKVKRRQSQCDISVLLAHEPQFLEEYSVANYDYIFSGHAHGGQIRVPFLGGLFSPGQGILPKYTSGVHKAGNGQMIVSRGLGNSSFPIRIFNRPEIILAEIQV